MHGSDNGRYNKNCDSTVRIFIIKVMTTSCAVYAELATCCNQQAFSVRSTCLVARITELPLQQSALGLQAFDSSLQHKWLDFGGANKGVTWLEYRLLPSQPAAAVTSYSLTSAEDEPNRDPCDFVLEGSVECATSSGTFLTPLLACVVLSPQVLFWLFWSLC